MHLREEQFVPRESIEKDCDRDALCSKKRKVPIVFRMLIGEYYCENDCA
jgi:hypothetical protein